MSFLCICLKVTIMKRLVKYCQYPAAHRGRNIQEQRAECSGNLRLSEKIIKTILNNIFLRHSGSAIVISTEIIKIHISMKNLSILNIMFFSIFSTLFSQTGGKKQYTATRITNPPVINGFLDDDSWRSGTWAGDFIQNQPYSGSAESQKTEFCILFDENNLYVAIKAFDSSPDSIVNRLTRRDQQDGELAGI